MDELLERAPFGFVSFGADGKVQTVNAALLDMLGLEREQAIGRPFESLLTVSSRIFYQTHLFPLLKLQPSVEELFLTMRCASGSDDVAMLASFAKREQDGTVVYDGAFMRLRERRKWEDEIIRAKRAAEEANRANSALLSMISHDLRTPIGSIAQYCDLLTMGIRGPLNEEQLADIGRMKKASDYVLSLFDDVLSFSRLRAGEVAKFDLRTLDAASVVAQTETLLGPRIDQAGLRYHHDGCTPDVHLVADPDRLQQILLNLVTNAVKFTPRGGTVTISCRNAGERTLISVCDTGRGIPSDHLERIFEPFVQVPGSSGTEGGRQKGFGLGLAISRDLARRMNGDLTVTSTLGSGSTFTVSLPAAAAS